MPKLDKIGLYRITHYKNLPFIVENGLLCSHCTPKDPDFIPIGQPKIISKRNERLVPIAPLGSLFDYVPFYFHYRMPMLHNITTGKVLGFDGTQDDIIYIATRVKTLHENGISFVFSDRNAALAVARFYQKEEKLENLIWDDIKAEYESFEQFRSIKETKQAELLVFQHLPFEQIQAIIVKTEEMATFVQATILLSNHKPKVVIEPKCYF